MSYAAYKLMHPTTGIDNCASGFITHSPADFFKLQQVCISSINVARCIAIKPSVSSAVFRVKDDRRPQANRKEPVDDAMANNCLWSVLVSEDGDSDMIECEEGRCGIPESPVHHHNGRKRRKRIGNKSKSDPNRHSSRTRIDPSGIASSNSIDRRSYRNPTFQGNSDSWYDSPVGLDSDGDEDFYSTQDDNLSQSSSISASVTPRFFDHVNGATFSTTNSLTMLGEAPPSSIDGVSTVGDGGILQNNCLPCLTCTTSTDVKSSKSRCSSPPPSAKKKVTSKLSFKWREGQSNLSIFSPKAVLQRPTACSQVPCCPIDKKMSDCWSPLEPSTFKVRGHNYLRDKKKENASNQAAFYPIGVDELRAEVHFLKIHQQSWAVLRTAIKTS